MASGAATTTAAVDTAGPGTVQLPYAPIQVAFDPAGTFALVATQTGVGAYVFDGQGVTPLAGWNMGGVDATGAAWLQDGASFAVSTTAQVAAYGIDSGGRVLRAAETAVAGVVGLAPGPASLPMALLAATAHGARLYEAYGTALVERSGGPSGLSGNDGVAATRDGAVAATWQRRAVQLWAWDGERYLRASGWDPPAPAAADGPVVGVAFFQQGGGYWVLTRQGQLLAYAYGTVGLQALSGMGRRVATMPAGLATGWGVDAAGVSYPTGWAYEDAQTGVFAPSGARSLGGQKWPAYAPRGTLQGSMLPIGHRVDEVRLEDASCASGQTPPHCTAQAYVPSGTAVTYAVSTDGCNMWKAAPPFTNVRVPAGDTLCYRLDLSTTDPTRTPVVDVTSLYEVAQQKTTGLVSARLCAGPTC